MVHFAGGRRHFAEMVHFAETVHSAEIESLPSMVHFAAGQFRG